MSKLRLSLILLVTVNLASSVAYAELFSFQNTNTPTSQTQTGQNETEPAPPLSAGDFKTQVAIKNQKAQQELFQKTQSQMPMAQPKPPQLNQQQSATKMPAEEQQSQISAKPTETAAPESTQTTVTTTTTTAPPPAAPAQSPVISTPNPATGAGTTPAQSQTYTGFSGGSTNSTTAVPSSQPNSGWNIKY